MVYLSGFSSSLSKDCYRYFEIRILCQGYYRVFTDRNITDQSSLQPYKFEEFDFLIFKVLLCITAHLLVWHTPAAAATHIFVGRDKFFFATASLAFDKLAPGPESKAQKQQQIPSFFWVMLLRQPSIGFGSI